MQTSRSLLFSITFLTVSLWNPLVAQKVGVATTTPQGPFHVASSGQVNTTGGLVILGDTSEAHLELDFDILQSNYGSGPLLLHLQPAGGDMRVGSTLMHMNSTNGFVGIGTITPDQKLELEGIGNQFLSVHTTSAGASIVGIDLNRSTAFSGTDWRIANDGGTFKIFDAINNFTGASDLNMVITQGGNVGIGTDAPEASLQIIGAQPVSETGEGYLQIGTPAGLHVRFDNNEILARSGDTPSDLYLQYWSGDLSLCDNNTGRVGVGVSNPQAKLHITDGTDVTLASGGELVLGPTSGANIAMDGNEIQARSNGAGSALFLQSDAGDVLMVPNENGQVGIGVGTSAAMPSNDYLLAVDGKIISEEIRVEISGSWPDYVFDDGYALTPLDVLEKQINEQGHLPGIPSAEQIEEDGVLLGDMQRMMMEKIEELTLYVIELKKEIDQLKKSNP